jgi:hypothetical protein
MKEIAILYGHMEIEDLISSDKKQDTIKYLLVVMHFLKPPVKPLVRLLR